MKDGQGTRKLLQLDAAVYSLAAVKKAAYRCMDRFTADISVDGSTIHCTLHFPAPSTAEQVEECLTAFRQEVADQDLRETIASETAAYRNTILALAFAPIQSDK